MNSNNDIQDPNLIELIKAFESGLIPNDSPLLEEYRFYYDSDGFIVSTTPTIKEANELNCPLPYIIVDKEQYLQLHKYKVEDNQLVEKSTASGQRVQLKKSTKGFNVVKNHANLLLEDLEQYHEIEYYDYRNS